MEKLKSSRILGIVANALLIIAVFLPVISVSVSLFGISQSQSVNYIQGDGIFVLILAIINLVIIFADKLATKIPFMAKVDNQKFTLIPTAINAILLIVLTFNGASALGGYASLAKVDFGIGFYLLWLGVIASAVYPFLYKGNGSTTTK